MWSKQRTSVRYVGTANVTGISRCVKGRRGTPQSGYEYGIPKNVGFLEDGSPYLVYRFALYMDKFNQHAAKNDTRSVCGCYILPLGYSLESKRKKGAPHVVTVSSCTTSRLKVLDMIIEDLCRAASEGVDGVDPYGRQVRIFLDMVTFLADYPEAADFIDVYGHSGNAYCTHCTVSKRSAPTGSTILST